MMTNEELAQEITISEQQLSKTKRHLLNLERIKERRELNQRGRND